MHVGKSTNYERIKMTSSSGVNILIVFCYLERKSYVLNFQEIW